MKQGGKVFCQLLQNSEGHRYKADVQFGGVWQLGRCFSWITFVNNFKRDFERQELIVRPLVYAATKSNLYRVFCTVFLLFQLTSHEMFQTRKFGDTIKQISLFI